MPWHQQATKDAILAKSLGELEKSIDPGVSEWGNPVGLNTHHPYAEYIGKGSKPAELKHLSRWRKRNQIEIP
jgi:hypothetical protein